ncbi:hypothetical protein GUITHDRAFT_153692 [Guillardia theta CCMP2712]|uniref:Uncharacterized protein n=2 Tax=Guillardia theta TaxID=55529 RepID=L1J1H8_GUITC|nr:hypothetical protein GUITHDRAFT_153692 [Guillardia theta CCMP2712]EKX41940.1 hypothetical protein GUITHDRAFT_153692 [Guillardia theta CCMP2712]|eukprot:XP_005828920.1 hypothetical protein GUITHDRAFT_153692 [Guillardia theta CCMP2712]
MSESVKEPTVESLLKQLEDEKRKNASLERNNADLKRKMGIQQSQIEAEAERITNKLMLRIEEIEKEKATMRLQVEAEERRLEHEKKELETKLQQSAAHLARLKHEKEALVRQVEQEEEFLTNTLQHKLAKVLAEKVEIENELEQEQEYISNRLQKQVVDTLKEKQDMERRLEEEKAKVLSMEEEKKKLARQLQSLQLNIEVEEERISNTLGKTVDQIKSEKEALIQKLEKEKATASALSREHELQRLELKKLQGTNYVMQQRIAKESKRLTEMQREKSLIAQRLEAEWERHFNMMVRERSCYPAFNRATSLEKWNLAEMEAVDLCDNSWNSVDPDGDVLGELSLTPRIFREKRRSGKWESQSLPSFSPRLSPYPSPPATPYSSRSRSPALNRSREYQCALSRSIYKQMQVI